MRVIGLVARFLLVQRQYDDDLPRLVKLVVRCTDVVMKSSPDFQDLGEGVEDTLNSVERLITLISCKFFSDLNISRVRVRKEYQNYNWVLCYVYPYNKYNHKFRKAPHHWAQPYASEMLI